MTGAVHLSNDNAGVLRPAQRGRKPRVEQKGKCWLYLSLQYGARSRNVGLSILFISEFEERGVRKVTTGKSSHSPQDTTRSREETALSVPINEVSEAGGRTVSGDLDYFLYTGTADPISTRYPCGIGGCTKEYKVVGGHLRKHILTVHRLRAWFEGETPPTRESGMLATERVSELSGVELDRAAGMGALGTASLALGITVQRPTERNGRSDPDSFGGAPDLVKCVAESEAPDTAYRDGRGKRLISLGESSGGCLRPWSETVVPMTCPFERCSYPPEGLRKSWKTWQNHCSMEHGWNIKSGVISRKRAGKDKAGTATVKSVSGGQPSGAGRAPAEPNVEIGPRSGAQTVDGALGNEAQESDKSGTQAIGEHGGASSTVTLRRSSRRLRGDALQH